MSSENSFVEVCNLKDLRENKGIRYFIDDRQIVLVKVADDVVAFDNYCPHQKAAVLHDGFIEDGHIVCPVHGWEFNLETGKLKSSNAGLRMHNVRIEDEKVFVKIINPIMNW